MADAHMPEQSKPATEAFDELLELWMKDLSAFARSFDIIDKNLNRIPVIPSTLQEEVFAFVQNNLKSIILKGRQIWVTTAIVFFVLRECLTRPGLRVCVAAHDDRAAIQIGAFYMQLYEMHPLLSDIMPRTNDSAHLMKFNNGSQIMFGTANSEFWRGFPTHIAHLTEAAMYDKLGKTLASLGQTVPASGRIILESTANGENSYHQIWDREDSSYTKLFLSWLHHPEYVSDAPMPDNLTDFEADFIGRYKLPPKRASWWAEKYRSLPVEERALVGQEYPPTAEAAFIMSGDKFLKFQVPLPFATDVDQRGIARIIPYDETHQYVAGVDVASGSTSASADSSTCCILDITARCVVATMQTWLPTPLFASRVFDLLKEYGTPLTAVEITGGYGLSVARDLRDMGVPMYLQTQHRGVADTLAAQHGWDTNQDTRPILYGGIFTACNGHKGVRWDIGCLRTVKEVNALCYNKAKRPGAPKNKHDDMATAFGVAIQAVPQAHPPAKVIPIKPVYKPPVQREWEMIQERGMAAVNAMRSNSELRPMPGDFYD